MKKLTLAFSLLAALATTGTAFADNDHDRDGRGRGPIVDHRDDRDGRDNDHRDHRDGGGIQVTDRRTPIYQPAPIVVQPAPIVVQPPIVAAPQAPAFAPGGQWDLLANKAAFGRRGTLTMMVPRGQSYDQLRLIASDRGLDITAIELSYGRGRTELVRPARDGFAAIDLGRGKLRSIKVHYVNRGGFGRGASIKVLAKDEGRMTFNGHDRGR